VARVLIVGGGCRGRRLAERLIHADGHAVRVTTRTESGRAAIERLGAQCVVGDPGRLATLAGVLEGVTVACWLLATAEGSPADVRALHGPRPRAFLGGAVDSTVRGFLYEAPAGLSPAAAGERAVAALAARNAIPVSFLRADPAGDPEAWVADARAQIAALLGASLP
jgi:nucleoside-diphosphate-sugar epimerase